MTEQTQTQETQTAQRGRPVTSTGKAVRKAVVTLLQEDALTPSQIVDKIKSEKMVADDQSVTKQTVLSALRYHEKQGIVSKGEAVKVTTTRGRPENQWQFVD